MSTAAARLRVLFLIDRAGEAGGAERFAIGLATHLPRERLDPWFCSTRTSNPATEQALADAGVPHLKLARRSKWDVHRLAGLVRLLRSERFDVLHAHMFGSNFWGTTIGRASGVPVLIAQEHSWSYGGDPFRAFLDGRVIGRLATRFVAVSASDGARMVRIEGVPRDKVLVMPTGYVPSRQPGTGDLRAELGLARNAPVVGIAAVLRPEKRLDLLLDAHARVVASLPDAHLVIAGHGRCRPDLERQAAALGLVGKVHFLGHRPDVDIVLRAVDVGALSSDREGSPLFVFECMASDTPLVATAVGGVRELVEDGRTGILVPRRDAAALADALVSLLTNPGRRAQLATAARERLDDFRIETIAGRFADLYEALAAEARSRAPSSRKGASIRRVASIRGGAGSRRW